MKKQNLRTRSARKTPPKLGPGKQRRDPLFKEFRSTILKADRILISTHVLPDGDGLGAESALYHYLKAAKKMCWVLNPDPLPKRYGFLDPEKSVLLGPDGSRQTQLTRSILKQDWDLWIILDTNDPRRLGKLWPAFSSHFKQVYFLDHHPLIRGKEKITYPPNSHLVSDPESSSIGELLYRLFQDLKVSEISSKTALGLYVSVMTDTNSFRYASTTPLAHRIAAEMIERGINPEDIYQAIYSSKEISHVRLLGQMLQNVKISRSGKIAWLEMDLALQKKHLASADDTLSFLNLLLMIREAEVICFFREEEGGRVRASIKSKGRVVINQVAMDLGGGGHEYAAGLALFQPLTKMVKQVINRLERLIIQS